MKSDRNVENNCSFSPSKILSFLHRLPIQILLLRCCINRGAAAWGPSPYKTCRSICSYTHAAPMTQTNCLVSYRTISYQNFKINSGNSPYISKIRDPEFLLDSRKTECQVTFPSKIHADCRKFLVYVADVILTRRTKIHL